MTCPDPQPTPLDEFDMELASHEAAEAMRALEHPAVQHELSSLTQRLVEAESALDESREAERQWCRASTFTPEHVDRLRAENTKLRAVIDNLVAPNTWHFTDDSTVGVPEGTFIISGVSAALPSTFYCLD